MCSTGKSDVKLHLRPTLPVSAGHFVTADSVVYAVYRLAHTTPEPFDRGGGHVGERVPGGSDLIKGPLKWIYVMGRYLVLGPHKVLGGSLMLARHLGIKLYTYLLKSPKEGLCGP